MKAIKEKKVTTGNIDECFVSSGFTNWKDATSARLKGTKYQMRTKPQSKQL